MRFDDYAIQHGHALFAPAFDNPEEQAFAAALTSFEQLSGFARGMVNARGETLNFSCFYVEGMKPNAFADMHEGEHVIGKWQALLVTIVEFALYVFTQADQFPQIGDAPGEDSPEPAFGAAPGIFLLEKTLRGETVTVDTDKHRVPKDADRHVAAIYLAMIMTRFVWLHELAHCTSGHVLFLKQHGIRAALNEVPDPAMLVGFKKATLEPDAVRRMLHAFELEADETALLGLCRVQMAGHENLPGIAALDFATRMEMCLLGAYLMSWLFDEYQRFANTMHDTTHPFPKDRLAHLVGFAAIEISPELDGFDEFHESVCASFNRLAARIPNMHRIDPGAATPRHDDPNLQVQLAPYRFIPVAPETAD